MRGLRSIRLIVPFFLVTSMVPGVMILGGVGGAPSASAASPCQSAGATGFTTVVDVTSSATPIPSNIDATGCDLGIYVTPGVDDVTIDGVTVTGANDHGIMAEGVSGLTIENSTIKDNGVNPHPGLGTNKGLELVAVTDSIVKNNTVTGNLADGGISVTDEGHGFDPAAPMGPATPAPSANVTITGNMVSDNFGGCGIIVESWVPGAGVNDITVSDNQIPGAPFQFGPHGPVIGQIIVATDASGAEVSGTNVSDNTVTGSFLSGITVHANAPGDSITNTTITGNTLSDNNWGRVNGAPQTTAIALEVNPIPPPATPVLSDTTISGNTMTDQFVGVWQSWQVTGTTLSANNFSGVHLHYVQPVPGKGYWLAASDGGVFAFGNAKFYGSLGSIHLNAPVVGMAQTRDQGGYLLAGSDGGVFALGNATFFGSLGSIHLNAPVVGIAPTPGNAGPPGTPGTNGLGYWLVANDGGVFAFGDAGFHGSMGGVHLNAPVVGMAATPDGLGYWLVAKDGGVFAFGDAGFFGSMGGVHLNAPVVGMAATPDGKGYWLVAKDGGVFALGDARFFGSLGGVHLKAPVVGMAASPDGQGYWLMAADGGVFAFGDAGFFGSLGGVHLKAPVVGGTATGSTGVAP